MSLLIALLTFFNVSFTSSTSSSVNIGWTSDQANTVKNSTTYQNYLKNGGTTLFGANGMPAVNVTIEPVIK